MDFSHRLDFGANVHNFIKLRRIVDRKNLLIFDTKKVKWRYK